MQEQKRFLRALFDQAVASAQPDRIVSGKLPAAPRGRTIIVGAGKAAATMARAVEKRWPSGLTGLVITPYGHAAPCRHIEVVEAGHPLPDSQGVDATRRILTMLADLTGDDLVICLLSGGGSALLCVPAGGITLEEKQSITNKLLRSGADIAEINCVRKHISAVKGGRLAAACAAARLVTLVISDVPGNDLSVIASGPTVPDATTAASALGVLMKYHIAVTAKVRRYLESPAAETPKPGDPAFSHSSAEILATADDAMCAAAEYAVAQNVQPLVLGDLAGEARQLAIQHASLAREIAAGQRQERPPCVVISGGESTVEVRGSGRGGRNSEYALALAIALDCHPSIHAIACDTDGVDGTEDNAGCFVTPDSLERARNKGLDANALLHDNDSYQFFSAIDDLVITGPTCTNVNDFRAILVTNR